MERFIVPYQFAVTDCHIRGDLCWYPGQVSAPVDAPLCDETCAPFLRPTVVSEDSVDYPLDEYTLAAAFGDNKEAAASWFNSHFDNFVSKDEIQELKDAGLTHLRVPLPHWILGDVRDDEVWIVGDRWKYFVRFCKWCREIGLEVWPDIHTAPGSQNGFDNSGQSLAGVSCQGWSNNQDHVERSLNVIRRVTSKVVKEGIDDVVTGFGLLNEPFKDCDRQVYEDFIEQGLDIVRRTLGPNTAVYVSDMFLAKTFNNGEWWLDPSRYNHTFLDSHYYHVFAEEPRALSPRQHIAYVCQYESKDAIACCYQDPRRPPVFLGIGGNPTNHYPSQAVKRMIGEWSVATDTLPVAMLLTVMEDIAKTGQAKHFDRQISPRRQDFLRHFAQAQMVAYEAADVGTAGAWFYWTFKMEGGAFAEWSFLRGLREGWIPKIPKPSVSSESIYGTCYDIIFRTDDDISIIDEFPDPATLPDGNWQGVDIDDDVVVSHGASLHLVDGHYEQRSSHAKLLVGGFALLVLVLVMGRFWGQRSRKGDYTRVADANVNEMAV